MNGWLIKTERLPESFFKLTSASFHSNNRIISKFPANTATCKGDTPLSRCRYIIYKQDRFVNKVFGYEGALCESVNDMAIPVISLTETPSLSISDTFLVSPALTASWISSRKYIHKMMKKKEY